jgi:CheY-like chemotaxis protein
MSKVLIADDDRVSCKLLAGLLTKWGYEADIVYNGVDAQRELGGKPAPQFAGPLAERCSVVPKRWAARVTPRRTRSGSSITPANRPPLFELRLSRQRTVAA